MPPNDVHTASFETDPLPQVYWSYRQWTQDRMVLAIRSAADQASLLPAVTRAIHCVDPEQSVYGVNTMATLVDHALAQRWLTTILIAGFAGFALVLAAVGLYGVVAFDVAPRDAASLGAATIALVVVAIFASYLPARRAARVDPAATLRAE